MKTIKDLTVKVTYTVGLSDVEVSDEVYESMTAAYDKGGEVPSPDECYLNGKQELSLASHWLTDNIQESDAMYWVYEIEDIVDF